jgi:hypothetical protein
MFKLPFEIKYKGEHDEAGAVIYDATGARVCDTPGIQGSYHDRKAWEKYEQHNQFILKGLVFAQTLYDVNKKLTKSGMSMSQSLSQDVAKAEKDFVKS